MGKAPGTRGDALRAGVRQLAMFGRYFPIRAKVTSVALSSRADRGDLLDWVGTATPASTIVHVNHGEPAASSALVDALHQQGLDAVAATAGERVRLDV